MPERVQPARRVDRGFKGWLDLTAAVIGVMAVLLPVEGVVIRWGSFLNAANSGGFRAPVGTVAVSASVPELVATGLAGIWLPAVAFVFGVGATGYVVDEWKFGSRHPWVRFLSVWLLFIGVPIALSFGSQTWLLGICDWLVASVGFASGVASYQWLLAQKVSVVGGLGLAVGLSLWFALVASLSGNPANVEPLVFQFQTQAAAQVPAGRYV